MKHCIENSIFVGEEDKENIHMADIQKCADDSQFGQNFILDKTFSNNILQKGVIRTRNKIFFKSSNFFSNNHRL